MTPTSMDLLIPTSKGTLSKGQHGAALLKTGQPVAEGEKEFQLFLDEQGLMKSSLGYIYKEELVQAVESSETKPSLTLKDLEIAIEQTHVTLESEAKLPTQEGEKNLEQKPSFFGSIQTGLIPSDQSELKIPETKFTPHDQFQSKTSISNQVKAPSPSMNQQVSENEQSEVPILSNSANQKTGMAIESETSLETKSSTSIFEATKSKANNTAAVASSTSDIIRDVASLNGGEAASKTAPTTQTERAVLNQITQKFSVLTEPGQSQVMVQLEPRELGKLNMNVTLKDDTVVVQFQVENSRVKEIIQSHLPQLRDSLSEQGLSVDRFDVSFGQDGTFMDQQKHQAFFKRSSTGLQQNGEESIEAPHFETHETSTQHILDVVV